MDDDSRPIEMTEETPEHAAQPAAPGPTPENEAAYRRAARRAVIATISIVLIVFGVAGLVGVKAIGRRYEGARNLDRAVKLLKAADGVILDADEVVRAEASKEMAERARKLVERVAVAKRDLEQAVDLIDRSMPAITENEQEQAKLYRDAATARLAMLGPAQTILAASVQAGEALQPARSGWEAVVAAEKLADDSVRQYNRLTKESVAASSKLAKQARAGLDSARSLFSQAATAFPEAGFERYIAYIDAKAGLLSLSQRSNTLWLAGRIAEANAVIGRYNAAEKSAIALADALPRTPGETIASAYERLAGQATTQYFAAREKATAADSRLDAY